MAYRRARFYQGKGVTAVGLAVLTLTGGMAQEVNSAADLAAHAECAYFTPGGERFKPLPGKRDPGYRSQFTLSRMTEDVANALSSIHKQSDASLPPPISSSKNFIDQYIYQGLKDANVTPADKTNDYEFLRRISLDLTGRIPTPAKVQSFVADTRVDKRSRLVDELLASSTFIDKWTMYFGDKFKNSQTVQSAGINRFAEGRDAFYQWIRNNLATNRPYNEVASELISAKGTNSYDPTQGAMNWLIGGRVNGPAQDIFDQQTANVAQTFLGLSHVNCVLCHNGSRHLTQLSYWGTQTTRYQAWQLSAFLAKTTEAIVKPDPVNSPNKYYWNIVDNHKTSDYQLNTVIGNRPARQPSSPTDKTVAPVYFFTGAAPAPGDNYRDFFAAQVTKDPLFATAAVNYMWKEFFGRGIVNPADQIDPARLDPDNLPQDCLPAQPCDIQPSNPYLLKALAQDFQKNGYDLKDLIRKIVTSETYQLSARWTGKWDPSWEPLFARKLVRRLWAEEISDAIALSSNLPIPYTIPGETTKVPWAMQLPETINNGFLGYFLPGNRDDQERRQDGAVQQALALMNDATIISRIKLTGTGATASTLSQIMTQPSNVLNDAYITNALFVAVLGRPANDQEIVVAAKQLQTGTGAAKADRAASLMWALYNKVDFIYNY